ncbi:MAG: dienelactone hydrolase family protein [Cyanobacteria bacterium Co-bin8]|nr:dienelactone hydrolase family protein [Cyanobacteria bacterium Co-bin8]
MTLKVLSLGAEVGEADWLLVALHGWGANAEDLASLAPYLQLSGFQMLFPNAPFPHPQVPLGRMWYGFPYSYDFRRPYDFAEQADFQESRRLLRDWLNSLADTTGIPLNRTILAGFSQGGAMALDVGSALPLAGQMILSGYLHAPLEASISNRPVLLVHGRVDPIVPLPKAHQAKAALEAQGITVQYHEMAMGHEILPDVIRLMTVFCEDLRQGQSGVTAKLLG